MKPTKGQLITGALVVLGVAIANRIEPLRDLLQGDQGFFSGFNKFFS